MPASTPDLVDGPVRIELALAEAEGFGLSEANWVVASWIDAVGLGFFGGASVRLRAPLQAEDERAVGSFDCQQLPRAALELLSRMADPRAGRAPVDLTGWPKPPVEPPFELELPEDLRRFVRIEIEFLAPPDPVAIRRLYEAFSIWDRLVEAMVEPEWIGADSERDSHRLSPRIFEHQVDGYYAGLECVWLMVLFGSRIHARLPIERLTIE